MDPARWNRLQALFEHAVSLPAEARTAYLQTACGDDPTLLAEARSLLEADSCADDLLQRIALPLAADTAPPVATPDSGEQVGPYRLLEQIGAGGMGVVFKALDTRLGRHAALKFLPPHLCRDARAKQRFLREARAAARLDHPGICTLYDIGETSDGQLYLAMAYCDGEDLKARIARGPLALEEALDIAVQVAAGLAAAHAQGIWHRDIKPSNVMLLDDGGVRIVDFGVAKIGGEAITASGQHVGTVAYMAPEQLRNEKTVDGRADVWALGTLLYEMLCGLRAFDGDNLGQVMHAVMFAEPTPLRTFLPQLPAAVERLVQRALAREPAQRHIDMAALLDEIVRLAPRPRETRAPAPCLAGEGGLRQASVLLVELGNYSTLASELPTARSQALLQRYRTITGEVIHGLGGNLHERVGDTLMGVFGAPQARGNDAVRATHAALDIHRRLQTLGRELDLPLAVHIGLASGPVVCGGEGAAFHVSGDTVNLAIRLQDMADRGDTLLSDTHHRLVAEHFHASRAGHLRLRGQDASLAVWRLQGAGRPARLRPLAGRHSELRLFRGLLEDCRDGRGQLLYVQGEAGIGKTRLSEEFMRLAAEAELAVHSSLILDFGVGSGQDAIGSLVRSLLGLPGDADAAQRRQRAEAFLAGDGADADQGAFLHDLLDLPLAPADKALFDALEAQRRQAGRHAMLVDLLRAACARQAVLLRVEDLHWADADTLDALARLVAAADELPLLAVFTSRREHSPLDGAWRHRLGDTALTSIDLKPLRQADALDLATALEVADADYTRRCVARAEGNPLFLIQLLQNAAGRDSDSLPPSLHNLVQAQLDRLPVEDRQALRAAAVIGQRFSEALLRHLIERPDYRCQRLVDHGLVRPQETDYLFSHALIQDGIYLSLLKAGKRALHRRAADWFAERDPLLHAEHLARADQPAAAAEAFCRAAQGEAARYRFERARQLAEQGLALVPGQPALVCALGDIQLGLGNVDAAERAYRQALAGDAEDELACRAWLGLAECRDIGDDFPGAVDALQAAQTLAEANNLSPALARLHYLRGNLYFPRGDIEACMGEHRRALHFAREVGCKEFEARALGGLGDAHYAAGRMVSASEVLQRCLALCEEHALGRVEAANRFMLGTVRIYLNHWEAALADSLASAETAARVGHMRAEIVSRLTAGWILIDGNQLQQARDQVRQALRLTHELGARRFQAFLQESQARILLAEGEAAQAREIAREALAGSREMGMNFIGPWILGTLALCSCDADERRAALAEGDSLLATGCVGHNYYRFYRAAMEVSLEDGAWAQAVDYAERLADYTRDEPCPWSEFFIQRTRALCDWHQATDDLRRAPGLRQRLQGLRDTANEAGLLASLPALASCV